jgi:hypothetical protein
MMGIMDFQGVGACPTRANNDQNDKKERISAW